MLNKFKMLFVGAVALTLAACSYVSPLQSVYMGCDSIYISLNYLTKIHNVGGLSKAQVEVINQVVETVTPICFQVEDLSNTPENIRIVAESAMKLIEVRKQIKGI